MTVTDNCGCKAPTDVICVATVTSCLRRDSAPVLTAGSPATLFSGIGQCINCPDCCETGGCPGYSISCGITCSIAFTQTHTASIASKIAVKGPIEASLDSTVGWTASSTLTVTQTCIVNDLQPCGRVFNQAWISYETGRKATMYHQWQLSGTWGGPGCPIPPPGTWYRDCGESSSTVTVSLATAQACNVLCADKCGPECDSYVH